MPSGRLGFTSYSTIFFGDASQKSETVNFPDFEEFRLHEIPMDGRQSMQFANTSTTHEKMRENLAGIHEGSRALMRDCFGIG